MAGDEVEKVGELRQTVYWLKLSLRLDGQCFLMKQTIEVE